MGSATREPYGGRVSADQPHRWRPMTSAPTDQHRWERAAALGFGETEPVDPWSIEQVEGERYDEARDNLGGVLARDPGNADAMTALDALVQELSLIHISEPTRPY